MKEKYEYSRKKIAETTNDVRFASNRRRVLFVIGGLVIAGAFYMLHNKIQAMSPEKLHDMIYDWAFIIACIPICLWFAAKLLPLLEDNSKK